MDSDTETEARAEPATDGGATVDVDPEELYAVVRVAVKDALFDALGSVLLLGLALLFVAAGVRGLLSASSTVESAFGVVFVGLGVTIAAVAFDLVPPFRA